MAERFTGNETSPDIWESWGRFEAVHPDKVRRVLVAFNHSAIVEMQTEGEPGPVRPHILEMMEEQALLVMADEILQAIDDLPGRTRLEAA